MKARFGTAHELLAFASSTNPLAKFGGTDWRTWSGNECGAFIANVAGLPQYRRLAENSFTGNIFKQLQAQHLACLGVTGFDEQRRIMKAVRCLRDVKFRATVRDELEQLAATEAATVTQAAARRWLARGSQRCAKAKLRAAKDDRAVRGQERRTVARALPLLGDELVFELVGGYFSLDDHLNFESTCATALERTIMQSTSHLEATLAAQRTRSDAALAAAVSPDSPAARSLEVIESA